MESFEQKLKEQSRSLYSVKDSEITNERYSFLVKLKDNWGLYQPKLKDKNDMWNNWFESEKEKRDKTRRKDAEKYELKIYTLQAKIENIKTSNTENLRNDGQEEKWYS